MIGIPDRLSPLPDLMDYQRNRLIIGGIIGVVGSLFLVVFDYRVLSFIVLVLGLISSIRVIFHGAPVRGLLLTKANGFLLLMFPFLVAASINFRNEKKRLGAANTAEEAPKSQGPKTNPTQGNLTTLGVIPSQPEQVQPQIRSEPESINAPSPPSDKDRALERVRTARKLELQDDLDAVMEQYADRVHYFGRWVPKAEIRADKADYWERWPVRKETITSDLNFSQPQDNSFEVTFKSTFRNENPKTGAWVSADLDNRYILREVHGGLFGLFVVEQSVVVSNLKERKEAEPFQKMQAYMTYKRKIMEVPQSLPSQIILEEGTRHPQAEILAIEAANIVRLTLEAEAKRDIQDTMSHFAFEVRYFGSDEVSEYIRTEKEKYFKKWPEVQEALISDYNVLVTPKPEITVTFTTKFTATNAEQSLERSGEIDHTFRLNFWKEDLHIREQNGNVRNLKTKELR